MSSVFCSSSAGSASDTPSSIGPGGPAKGAPTPAGPPWPAASPDAPASPGARADGPCARAPPEEELAAGAGVLATFSRAWSA
eukprot:5343423-Alexandrium_andersonii.AAC.1